MAGPYEQMAVRRFLPVHKKDPKRGDARVAKCIIWMEWPNPSQINERTHEEGEEKERGRERTREREGGREKGGQKKVTAFLRFQISLKKNREIPFVRRSCGNRHNALSLRISHGNAALPLKILYLSSGDSLKSEEFFSKLILERSVLNPPRDVFVPKLGNGREWEIDFHCYSPTTNFARHQMHEYVIYSTLSTASCIRCITDCQEIFVRPDSHRQYLFGL